MERLEKEGRKVEGGMEWLVDEGTRRGERGGIISVISSVLYFPLRTNRLMYLTRFYLISSFSSFSEFLPFLSPISPSVTLFKIPPCLYAL